MSPAHAHGSYSWARDDDSRGWSSGVGLNLRPSNRLSLSGSVSYEKLLDNLQYVDTADRDSGQPRWVLGRIDQDTWNFTFRVNLSITPELTVQYYGSPFIGTGRYTGFKKATDTLAQDNADRFHLYGPDEIAYSAEDNAYRVTEAGGGPSYSFAQPRLQLPAVPLEPRRAVGVEAGLVALRRLVAGPHGLRPGVGRLLLARTGTSLRRQRRPTTSSWSSSATGSRLSILGGAASHPPDPPLAAPE